MSSEDTKVNNDMIVKQEYVTTESAETSAQPPAQAEPRKPAQEQTRTENLQRIQQRKLKVIVFSYGFKFILILLFFCEDI